MKLFISIALLVITQLSIGQTTSLVISSHEDNFLLFVNGVKQAKTPTKYIRVKNYNETQADIKISFSDNNDAPFEKIIMFDAGGENHYLISKNEGTYNLVWEKHLEWDATIPISEGQIEVNYTDPDGKEHLPPIHEEQYHGEKGCEKAMPTGEVLGLYKSMLQLHYPDEKYKLASKSLKNRCVSTEHIIKLLSSFKNEFYEEKFTIFIHEYTYDLDNFNKVIETLTEQSQQNVKSKFGL